MRHYCLIALIALALRLPLLVGAYHHPDRMMRSDSLDYKRLATTLITEGRYDSVERPPAYPAFLALVNDDRTAMLIQVAVDVALCLILALRFHPLAGALQAVSTISASYSTLILSESIFTFLLMITLLKARLVKRRASAWIVGLYFGVLCLWRAIAFPWACLVLCTFLLTRGKRYIPSLTVFGLIVSAWLISNGYSFQHWARYQDAAHPILCNVRTLYANLLPGAGEYLRGLGFPIGGNGTLSVLKSCGIAEAIRNYFDGHVWLLILAIPDIMVTVFRYVFCIAGIWLLGSVRLDSLFLTHILTLFYFVLVPGAVSEPRFRVPVEPLINAFASYGFICFNEAWRKIYGLPLDA